MRAMKTIRPTALTVSADFSKPTIGLADAEENCPAQDRYQKEEQVGTQRQGQVVKNAADNEDDERNDQVGNDLHGQPARHDGPCRRGRDTQALEHALFAVARPRSTCNRGSKSRRARKQCTNR